MISLLKIAPNLSLPLEAVTDTFAILAVRGVGKTHTASVMAEEMLKAGQPIVAYDPTGAWWGLKSSADGRHAGFPVVVFGGEHADVPLEETAGATIATTIVEKRIPAILDCVLMRKAARIRFMTDFCETLYHKNREALHLFLDEAHTVAPQNIRSMPEAARLLGAVEDIVLQGRRRGLGLTAISQRPALLNTNIRSQCMTLIAMRIFGKHDRKAIDEWIEAHGDPATAKAMLGDLPALPKGDAWVWNAAAELFKRVHFRGRDTFDSSATPKVGGKVITPQKMAAVDLDALGQAIKATVEKAKADDPKELRKRIAELEKQLKGQPAATKTVEVEKRVEVPVLKNGQLERTEKIAARMAEMSEKFAESARQLCTTISPAFSKPPAQVPARQPIAAPVAKRPQTIPNPNPAKIPRPAIAPTEAGDVKLGKAEFNVVRALYWTKEDASTDFAKVCFLAGYSPTASTVGVSLSKLRKVGWVEPAALRLTDVGLENVPADIGPKPRGSELREWIRGKVGPAENKILDVLLSQPDRAFTNDELADETGYSREASTVGVALSKLRKFEAIEGGGRSGGITAASVFFEE